MYQAILATVKVTPIKGANHIAAGVCNGFSVIVARDTPDGALGIYFPVGGQLSNEMAMANNLYAKHPETGEAMGGHLDANRRIRTKRFMGIDAEGLWLPLDSLSWIFGYAGIDRVAECSDFCENKGAGYIIEGSLFGKLICQRYMPKHSRTTTAAGVKTKRLDVPGFPMHFDTGQLRMNLGQIKVGDRLHFSEKAHGTSGRTCKVREEITLPWWKRFTNRIVHSMGFQGFATDRIATYSGTRRCIVTLGADGEKGMQYRIAVHERIAPLLRIGEVVYYEIVGFSHDGLPIMPPHHVPENMRKKLGMLQVYSYGCEPVRPEDDLAVAQGAYTPEEIWGTGGRPQTTGVYVYRITQDGVDLAQTEIDRRCIDLGLPTCPAILSYTYDGNAELLMEVCKVICDGKSRTFDWSIVPDLWIAKDLAHLRNMTIMSDLDSSHIREGVCVRVERDEPIEIKGLTTLDRWLAQKRKFVDVFKYKSWAFCHLEDIRPNTEEGIDLDPDEIEEVA